MMMVLFVFCLMVVMVDSDVIVSPTDLMGETCDCGNDEFYSVGCTRHQAIYECTDCGALLYGVD